jgi:hypothetical protein
MANGSSTMPQAKGTYLTAAITNQQASKLVNSDPLFSILQDLVQLVNADQPYWLIGMTEMTRTFGLELLESVLTQFSSVFFQVSVEN